ncbi:TniQ family protein [Ornithinimicrobium panacihumi]|uniref:TniQ family protein n=1 Tax=Ornithinimicrobium panacihumi TaxID=2008449 RepID=UPI003F8A3B9C
MTGPLPVRVAPRPGQALDSYLEHLADANQLTTTALAAYLRRVSGAPTRYLTLAPDPALLATIAALADIDPAQLATTVLSELPTVPALTTAGRYGHRQVAAQGWIQLGHTQACPGCLAATGAWSTTWRLLTVTTCTLHARHLIITCPGCHRPLRDTRHQHLRPVGATTLCGNPTGTGYGPGPRCQLDLATVTATQATTSHLDRQRRVDTALAGQPITVLGRPSSAEDYLADLHHLAVLLLHLASQDGTEHLAPWVPSIRAEATARTHTRGPRWGLSPPADPPLRAQVLTLADQILTAPDRHSGADTLSAWVLHAPTMTDSRLGWLSDRTVMTPTLTRLVMAARAPHRRLSHHLDTPQSDGARRSINLLAIPQVIPHEQYLEQLAGASDSSEATVRLFGSLSLARLHPDIKSWASAAAALGMPGPMGVRCARACSATMLVTADEWEARIWRAIEETPRENYRALEVKIRHRLGMSRWFAEWARRYRPGTRHGTYNLGLTWQWVHVAHAHLDLSPGWRGRTPTAKDRARYRQFEASLDDRQRRGLTHALLQRA